MPETVYPVPAAWAQAALVDAAGYARMYRRSVEDPDAFWRDEAQRIDWIAPFTRTDESSFAADGFGIRWFADGTLNLGGQLPRSAPGRARRDHRHPVGAR